MKDKPGASRCPCSGRIGMSVFGTLLTLLQGVLGAAEPYLVRDLNESPPWGEKPDPSVLAFLADRAFFAVDDGPHGQELWITDGTPEGTTLVKDIRPGWEGSNPQAFAVHGDRIFFKADDGIHGSELWVTDGTSDGTALFKDIKPGPEGSCWANAAGLSHGNRFFFDADDGTHGMEPWVTDGTPDGTVLLRDATPGSAGSYGVFRTFALLGDRLLFSAGYRLWVTDGSPQGTVLVKDLWVVGTVSALGDRVLFAAEDGTHGWELWVTDGTPEGTALLKDINPGSESSRPGVEAGADPGGFAALRDRAVFPADDGTHGRELWVTDGTPAGTLLLRDIVPGSEGSGPCAFVAVGDQLFFNLFSSSFGLPYSELWVTDGTPEGTMLWRAALGQPETWKVYSAPIAFGGQLFFTADDGTHGSELWRTEGTPEGTSLFKDIYEGSGSSGPASYSILGDRLFFAADDGTHGYELWATDGTPEGTALVEDIQPGSGHSGPRIFTALGNRLLFWADDGTHGREPWITDGTPEGTVLVKDINQIVSSGSLPGNFTSLDGQLVFTTHRPCALWATDGTADGTVLLAESSWEGCCGCGISCPISENGIVQVNDRLFFIHGIEPWVWGHEVWVTDGTPEGTLPWREALGQPETWRVQSAPTVLADRLFFTADDGTHGTEPWVTDGTPEGTVLLKDIQPAEQNWSSSPFTVYGDRAFFTVDDGTHGWELWVTDGTPEGTVIVKDIYPGAGSSNTGSFTVLGDRLFFTADDGTHGLESWVTDGTPEGTVPWRERLGQPETWFAFVPPIAFDDRLFFLASDDTNGLEPWVTDGTPGGTALVKDINPGPGSSHVGDITAFGGRLIFSADDGMHGREPWVTDGTSEGTVLLKDISPGPAESIAGWGYTWGYGWAPAAIPQFTTLGDRAFFVASDGVHGRELWVTDGTPEGTVLVSDIYPGSAGSYPSSLAVHGDRLFFMAWDAAHGGQLWMTDGMPDGTLSVAPGALFATPPYCEWNGACQGGPCPSFDMVSAGDHLFFVADDGIHGLELWAIGYSSPSADFTLAPEGCQPGRKVLLDAGPSLPGEASEIVRFEWDLGGGVVLEGPAVEYEYPPGVSGLQRICLTVTNDQGFSHSTCKDFCIEAPAPFRRGDANDDGAADISDAVFILGWLFLGTSSPPCVAATDTNGDGAADISDAVSLLGFLFLGGPPPAGPFPGCGPGTLPTDEVLGCATAPVACRLSEGGGADGSN